MYSASKYLEDHRQILTGSREVTDMASSAHALRDALAEVLQECDEIQDAGDPTEQALAGKIEALIATMLEQRLR